MPEKLVEVKKESGQTGRTVSIDAVREQILKYEKDVKTYLDRLDASVDSYKFSVEKLDGGISVDLSFRATIHPRDSARPR